MWIETANGDLVQDRWISRIYVTGREDRATLAFEIAGNHEVAYQRFFCKEAHLGTSQDAFHQARDALDKLKSQLDRIHGARPRTEVRQGNGDE